MNLYSKRIIFFIGVIILVLGVVFSLQSQSILGPKSSFMYNNGDCGIYGTVLCLIGIFMITSGIFLRK